MPHLNVLANGLLRRLSLLSVAVVLVSSSGLAHGDLPNFGKHDQPSQARSTTSLVADLKELFSDGEDGAVTSLSLMSRGSSAPSVSSEIRLVSQETSAPAPSAATPTFALQQPPVFQDASAGAYTGPATTRGTWAIVAPYGWISGINGQLASPVGVLNIDVSPSDVLDSLGDVNGALMLHTEVGRGDYGLIIDANIIRLTPQVQTVPALINVDLKQTMIEFLGTARVVDAHGYWVEGKSLTVDLIAGGRYYNFSNGLTIIPVLPLPTLQIERSKTWVDMVIGARARVPLTESLDGFVRADFGGFGVGSSSSLAWNFIAGLDYQWSESTSILAGYRTLDIDQFSGAGPTASGFDVQLHGPFAAFAFQF